MQGQALDHIFELIENLKCEIVLLKLLVQQAVSAEEIGQDILVDDVAYLSSATIRRTSEHTLPGYQSAFLRQHSTSSYGSQRDQRS